MGQVNEYNETVRSNPEYQRVVNVLELLDAEPTLAALYKGMSMWGMRVIDGKQIAWREYKPTWSDDFCMDIINFLRFHSNNVHSQSELEENYIALQIRNSLGSRNRKIAVDGRDNYITNKIWEEIRFDWKKEGKDWHTQPISRTLVTQYRGPTDHGAFVTDWQDLIMEMQAFIKSSLNRGKNALTLNFFQNASHTNVQQSEKKKSRLSYIGRQGGNQDVA